jgi:hypothetical protein
MTEEEQLELVPRAWVCPLYGCRQGCTCTPEQRAETQRRQERSEAERRNRGRRSASPGEGQSNRIPFEPA